MRADSGVPLWRALRHCSLTMVGILDSSHQMDSLFFTVYLGTKMMLRVRHGWHVSKAALTQGLSCP